MKSATQVISKYRQEQNLSLRDFAKLLSANLGQPISHQTIKNWEDGTYNPSYFLLLALSHSYTDWRRDMALECMRQS
jgi:transcriptional regulator with XRE-family HTH domain